MEKSNGLPTGWERVLLSQIAKINPSKPEKDSLHDELEVSFVPMKCVEELTGKIDLSETRKYKQVKKGYTFFQDGDIIFAKITPCMENGKIAIAQGLTNSIGFGSTEFHVVRLKDENVSRKFYFRYLMQDDFRNKAQRKMKGTAGQLRVSSDYMKNVLVPLPPLNEQKRIISKIEELFSKIDTNVENLEKTKIQANQYKKSLLKYAFKGKLTFDWRNEKRNQLESGDVVLERIKKIKKTNNESFKEISNDQIKKLPILPEEWRWTYLSNLGELSRGKSKHRPRNDHILFGGKYPFIQTGIVRNSNDRITSYHQTYNERGLAQSRLFPEGTLCITIAANIAETAMLTFPSCFPDSIVGFIGLSGLVNTMLVMYYVKSNQTKLEAIAPATAQKNINLNILQNVIIPIMSYEEQSKIADSIERGFSIMNKNLDLIESEKNHLKNLKQSILKQAFKGKLVTQDPNDESAEILLQKIKQEKEKLKQKQMIIKANLAKRKRKNVK